MKKIFRDLWLAIGLILGASALLLLSDLGQRQTRKNVEPENYPAIAIMQISATPVLDSHVQGVLDKLESEGLIAPDMGNISRFNPHGDIGTANAVAREIANGPYELVVTSSTVALQTFAKVNKNIRKPHIFGAVTDPYGTGVGITGPEPGQHPPHMAGVGTFQPVGEAFGILREMKPGIKKVGVVWNPGEQCSEACMLEARAICRELGIELVEAIASNTSEVSEAVRSLLAKGVEAIWIGGDTVAMASAPMIIKMASDADVPVFTNDPSDVDRGALFGLGANYYTVGLVTGGLAVEVLKGKSPAEIAIEDVVPQKLSVNRELFAEPSGGWSLNDRLKAMIEETNAVGDPGKIVDFRYADKNIPAQELIEAAKILNLHELYGRPVKICIINLVENLPMELAINGVIGGLTESGLMEGEDYTLRHFCAQGEIGNLPQLIDAARMEGPDLIMTVTTPALIAAASRVKDIPLVFTVASDPMKINLFGDKIPDNICGVHDDPPVDELLDMAIENIEGLQKAGIIYDPAQVNALISVEKLRKAGNERGIGILEATASSVPDLSMAAQSLVNRGAQIFVISADNLAYTGFPSILKVARNSGVPIYVTELELVNFGATAGIGDDFFSWGVQSGKMAARVLAGVSPALLGFEVTQEQNRIEPGELQTTLSRDEPFLLRIVHYSETEFAERCHEGLVDGLNNAGLREGIDYELKTYNAQGDMSTLSSIMTTIKSDNVDLLMVISTPTLQAALRQAGPETKIVFTGVGDGVKAGAGKSEKDHLPNVTGITTQSPFNGMARIIRETLPGVKSVGTLFTPSEINSVLYKDWFKEALKEYGIELVAVPVSSSTEVAQAAIDLCQQDIQMVGQIVDNLTRPGFALIAGKANAKNLPVYCFDSDQVKDGATLCLARDYYDAGLEAAHKAVRVLRGENPAHIPFNNTQSEKLIYNARLAKKYNLKITDSLKERATILENQ